MNGRDIQSIIDDLEELPVEKSYASVASFRFPLAGDGPFLCSQGFNGHFTHFFLVRRAVLIKRQSRGVGKARNREQDERALARRRTGSDR